MKKRILSGLLAVLMVMALIPASAINIFAASISTVSFTRDSKDHDLLTFKIRADSKTEAIYYAYGDYDDKPENLTFTAIKREQFPTKSGESLVFTFNSYDAKKVWYIALEEKDVPAEYGDLTSAQKKKAASKSVQAYVAFAEAYIERDNLAKDKATFNFKIEGGEMGRVILHYGLSTSSAGSASGLPYSMVLNATTGAYIDENGYLCGSFAIPGVTEKSSTFRYYITKDEGKDWSVKTNTASLSVPAYDKTVAPVISDMYITKRESNYVELSFKSDTVGTLYYKIYKYGSEEEIAEYEKDLAQITAWNETYDGTLDHEEDPKIDAYVSGYSGTLSMKAGSQVLRISNIKGERFYVIYWTQGTHATSSIISEFFVLEVPEHGATTAKPVFSNAIDESGTTLPYFRRSNDEKYAATKAYFSFRVNIDSIVYYRVGSANYSADEILRAENGSISCSANTDYEIEIPVTTAITGISFFAVNKLDTEKACEPIGAEIGKYDDKIAPAITNVSIERSTARAATFKFESSEAATMKYTTGSASVLEEVKLNMSVGVSAGVNEILIPLPGPSAYVISFMLTDALSNKTEIMTVTVAAWTVNDGFNDEFAPTITSVTRSRDNSSWVNGTTGVTITVTAAANKDYEGTKTLEYSFDGGMTWSTSRSKIYKENTTIAAGQIRVRHYNDISVRSYNNAISITNIDSVSPVFTVATDPVSITANSAKASIVTVYITAKDTQSGLASAAYSFDGGVTWQLDSFKSYTKNAVLAANSIAVRDAAGNIAKYPQAISIENIDDTVPTVQITSVTRSTSTIGSIEVTSSEKGKFYYLAIYNALDAVMEADKYDKLKNSYDMIEGKNTFQIALNPDVLAAVFYYAVDDAGNATKLAYVDMPKFTEPDKTAPKIEKVELSVPASRYTNKPVRVTVTASDETALDNTAYSFDNGVTWQKENYKEYAANTQLPANRIQVKDAAGNITTYNQAVIISNIDTSAPQITGIIPAAVGNYAVSLTVEAKDNAALAAQPYSFDGGNTWQVSSRKIYTSIVNVPANTICVRDAAGNITKYALRIPATTLEAILEQQNWNNPFTDVSESDWYYDYVEYVVRKGYFNGMSETEFGPATVTTRAMFVTFLGRLEGINTSLYRGTAFSDVRTGQWYTPYISWASSAGIVNGYGNGIFGLNDPITREQMCVMILNYFNYKGISLGYTAKNIGFADAARVSSWAREAVSICEQAGIIIGANNQFRPGDVATRAEVAVIFKRISENYLGGSEL